MRICLVNRNEIGNSVSKLPWLAIGKGYLLLGIVCRTYRLEHGVSRRDGALVQRHEALPVPISPSVFRSSLPKPTSETVVLGPTLIYLDTYMLCGVYQESGICVRNHCRAEPSRDTEPAGLVTTVSRRDRAPASYDAADRVKAPASAARSRFRGVHRRRTAPSLPAETRTVSGAGCLAGSVPSVLVRSCGCSRTAPRPDGSFNTNEGNTNEREDKE